jgi:hypothetical protein
MMNDPPSAIVNINESLDVPYLRDKIQIKKLMNTVSGDPHCYVYD